MLSFDFETHNFVNKEESVKNEEAEKKKKNEMTLLKISHATGKFKFDGEDIYLKFVLGPNFFKTAFIDNAKKDFKIDINKGIYAESQETRLVVGVYDKDLINDDVLGSGELMLEGIASGDCTVKIHNEKK